MADVTNQPAPERPRPPTSVVPYLGAVLAIVAVTATGIWLAEQQPAPVDRGSVAEDATDSTLAQLELDTTTTTISRLGGFGWNVPTGPIPTKRANIVDAMVGERGVTPENPWAIVTPTSEPSWEGAPAATRARLVIRTSGYWTGRDAWLYVLEGDIERPPLVADDGPLDPDGISILAIRAETEPDDRSCLEDSLAAVATIHSSDACLDEWGQLVWEESATLMTAWWRHGSVADVAAWLDSWSTIYSNGAGG